MFNFDNVLQKDYDFIVSTDGLCDKNHQGTWAFVVFNPLTKKYIAHRKSADLNTTEEAQERAAILAAIEWADKHNKTLHIKARNSLIPVSDRHKLEVVPKIDYFLDVANMYCSEKYMNTFI